MKKKAGILLLGAMLTALVLAMAVLPRGAGAVNASEDQTDFAWIVQQGADNAWSSVKNGTGKVSVCGKRTKGGETLEWNTEYVMSFRGQRFKLSLKDGPQTYSGRWVRTYREDPPGSDLRDETYASDGQTVTKYIPAEQGASIDSKDSALGAQAMSELQLVSVFRHGVFRLSPERSAENPRVTYSPLKVVGHESLGGDDCVLVEQQSSVRLPNSTIPGLLKFWVCPNKGYAVPRQQFLYTIPGTSEMRLWGQVDTDLRKYGRELWGPARSEVTQYGTDDAGSWVVTRHEVITYDPGFRLNVPDSELDLELRLPSGTAVKNDILGAIYAVP